MQGKLSYSAQLFLNLTLEKNRKSQSLFPQSFQNSFNYPLSLMFNETLEKIIKRQTYIDQLSEQQIGTIQTKEVFFKALEQSPQMNLYNLESPNLQEKLFLSPFMEGPATNLLKHILPTPQNSYEEIQQLEARIHLFNEKKLNQVEILKSMFADEKQNIKASGLKVSDFLDIYESEEMQGHQKDINDPLIKKITTIFETNTKEYFLEELLRTIIEGVSACQEKESQDNSQSKLIRRIRQSVCSMQGLNVSIEDSENQFNQETKKQMDKIMSYYDNLLQMFDIVNEQ